MNAGRRSPQRKSTANSAVAFTDEARRTLENLLTATWIFDVDRKRIHWANAAACKLWGAKDLDEILNRDFTDISESALARLNGYFDRLEIHEEVAEQWTFYPRGREKREGTELYTVTAA